MFKFRYCILLFFLFALTTLCGQGRFPIQVYPILTPPYSLRLSDYAQFGSQRLVINVQVQDATIANLPIRLHIKFENFNGSSIENIPNFPIQPIYLNGGETRIFFGEDLAPYFNPDNLIFNGYSREQYRRTGQLPEGYYRVTAQIRHYYTNRLISNIGFTSAHFALGKPPILLKPDNETELGNIPGAPLTFSWQNSRTIVPGANVQYKFEMWELRLPGINPYVYVNSMAPFYTEQSFMSPLQIYPAMHNFEPGMKYAWRVTAGDVMDLVPFEQDGKSEVRTFTFMSKCDPPANLKVEQKSRDALYSWTPNTNHTSYTVEAEDITDGTQRSYTTYDNRYTLRELDYGHEYRLRVRAICNGNDFHPSDFTEWVKFKLAEPPKRDSCPDCECGEVDRSNIPPITNFELKRDLKKGDIVYRPSTETRFEIITAKEVGNGVYEGQFYFMWEIYGAKVLANYENLQVNTDNIVLSGLKFETVQTLGLVANVDAIEDALDGDDGDENNSGEDNKDIPHDTIITDFDLPDNPQITYNEDDGTITITDENGDNPITIDLPKDENGNTNFPVTIVDNNGDTYIVTQDESGNINIEKQQTEQEEKQISNSNTGDSTAVYIFYNNIRYGNGEKVVIPKESGKSIKIYACDAKGNVLKDSVGWQGITSYNKSDTFATYDISNITEERGKNIGVTHNKLSCNITLLIVDGTFSRCEETGIYVNKYGYDEMDATNANDDHISVASNSETYVKLNISGQTDLSRLYFDVDTNMVRIELTSDPKILKIRAGDFSHDITLLKVATQSNRASFFTQLTICIYKEIKIEDAKVYAIYQLGNPETMPEALNTDLIRQEANNYLKYQTASIRNVLPMSYESIDFDKNHNGVIDFYNDGNNPETSAIYDYLKDKGATATSIVLIKNRINDIWRISDSINVGDDTITIINPVHKLDINNSYVISLPNGENAEIFKIVEFVNASTLVIDTDPNTPGNQGFVYDHPKVSGDDILSHRIKPESVIVAGLSASLRRNRPALIVGVTETDIGYLFAHEFMHAYKIWDINNETNIMHYRKSITTVRLNPFTFTIQRVVETGTPDETGETQNQWHDISRD
jgi:hypothetical protein